MVREVWKSVCLAGALSSALLACNSSQQETKSEASPTPDSQALSAAANRLFDLADRVDAREKKWSLAFLTAALQDEAAELAEAAEEGSTLSDDLKSAGAVAGRSNVSPQAADTIANSMKTARREEDAADEYVAKISFTVSDVYDNHVRLHNDTRFQRHLHQEAAALRVAGREFLSQIPSPAPTGDH
jgi:seryl-tRNA synthetase